MPPLSPPSSAPVARHGLEPCRGRRRRPGIGRKDYHLLGRTDFQQTLLRDRLEAALRRLNRNDDGSEWLDDRRINQAISQLERPTAKDFIAINEELHDKIVRGVNVSGPDGEHERRVRFARFEPGDENEFVAVNQFRVDPPGASGVSGFIVPDVVLFLNGLPLVVIEAKSSRRHRPNRHRDRPDAPLCQSPRSR